MTTIIQYFYFRFFKFSKAFSFGASKPQYRAAFWASTSTLSYMFSIYIFILNQTPVKTPWLVYTIPIAVYVLFLMFFLSPKRYRSALKRFNESFVISILGNWITAIYILTSYALSLKALVEN